MLIEKKRIRNLGHYLGHIPNTGRFRVAFRGADSKDFKKLGFVEKPNPGDTILPAPVGTVSRFNSDGKWIKLKHLPKENRFIHTIMWRWQTWNGDEQEKPVDIYRHCYQRSLIPPPAIELTFLEKDGTGILTSPILNHPKSKVENNAVLHVINLFLEIFGSCEIVADDLSSFSIPTKRVNWVMLPPGKHPWPRVKEHIEAMPFGTRKGAKDIVLDRQKFIISLAPDEMWKGMGGFSDYLAYIFNSKQMVVLESLRYGNAIYIFGDNWQSIAKLTKAQVLQNSLHIARITHAKGWRSKLKANLIVPARELADFKS